MAKNQTIAGSALFFFGLIMLLVSISYPLLAVAPGQQGTFGNTTVGVMQNSGGIENVIFGSTFLCPQAGIAQSITAHVMATDTSYLMTAAIYDQNLNVVAQCTEITVPRSPVSPGGWVIGEWQTWTFKDPKPNLQSMNYTLVVWSENKDYSYSYMECDSVVNYMSVRYAATYGTSFPASLSSATKQKLMGSIYCTYIASGLPTQYTLQIMPSSGGRTSPQAGTHTYASGESVSVTATADSGFHFTNWTLDAATYTANPITVAMDTNHVLTANFAPTVLPQYTLTITAGSGGTTTPAPGTYTYDSGVSVTVTAAANSGYKFKNWLLDSAVSTSNPIVVLMTQNHNLQAVFEPVIPTKYSLTILVSIGGSTSPAAGTYQYDIGASVSVSATATSGFIFSSWLLDGVVFTVNPISITMNKDHTLQAWFAVPTKRSLAISINGSGTTSPSAGTYSYDDGTTASVTATPNSGNYFKSWTVNSATFTSNPLILIMDKDYVVVANFQPTQPPPPDKYKLTITAVTGGSTNPLPGTYDAAVGSTVSITAQAYAGYTFKNWELDGTMRIENPISVLMDRDHTMKPIFEKSKGTPVNILSILGIVFMATGFVVIVQTKKTPR